MNILDYNIYIFTLNEILIENKIEFISGWKEFCNFLLKHNKKVYIIANLVSDLNHGISDTLVINSTKSSSDFLNRQRFGMGQSPITSSAVTTIEDKNGNTSGVPFDIFNDLNFQSKNKLITKLTIDILLLNNPFLLKTNIIKTNNITSRNYFKIVNENLHTTELYDFISFHNCYKNLQKIKKFIYNYVLVGDNFNNNLVKNWIPNYLNIKQFVYKKEFEYVPFYISSKTKHRNKWIELRKHFPIMASWIENDKDKYHLSITNKMNICDSINNDINQSSFGIFYCERNEENHIGSLIEIGLLLGKSKTIFLCGDNIYEDEVLFRFKSFINFDYVNDHNLYKVIKKIQYNISLHYMSFKENIKQFCEPLTLSY